MKEKPASLGCSRMPGIKKGDYTMEEKVKSKPKKKKKPFVPMEIAKVPLNQDQAVLSCCEQPERGPQYEGVEFWQCDLGMGFCGSPETTGSVAS